MNILSVEDISKNFGDKQLFEQLSFGIETGERIGIIGVNGSGKTTLLRLLGGQEPPDSGRIVFASSARVAYLPQNPDLNESLTVLEQLFRGEGDVVKLLRDYEALTAQLEEQPNNSALLDRLAELSQKMDHADAWELERRARAVLSRLGIRDVQARIATLSGGQRRRVALAGALLNPSDLLILDEPTNHLDTDLIAWLEEELRRYSGAILLVTHDRYFLDRIVNRMVELDRGRVTVYTGNYSSYLEQRAARLLQEVAAEEARQNLLRKELVWLRRGAQARTTKQKAHVERVHDLMNTKAAERPAEMDDISIASRRIGKRVFEIKDLNKGYDGRSLVRNFSYTIEPGEKLGIIGPNGGGKTTLLNMIAERIQPDSGSIVKGETVHLAYYDQESQGLDTSLRVIDYVREAAELAKTGEGALLSATQMLERFLFPSAAQYAYISTLSGGERRRLYLLRQLLQAPNVLLLDEPTNDLDIQTLNVLEDFLDSFKGTLITVSHDRYFLDRTVERLLVFDGEGQIRLFPGGYSMYRELYEREQAEREQSAAKKTAAPAKAQSAPASSAAPQGKRKASYKERRELAGLEERIATLESEIATVQEKMAQPDQAYTVYQELGERLAQLSGELENTFERWTELAELVGE
jgi:ATP-binding cassette subfamily F protein uup